MSFGLPQHLAMRSLREAITSASHAAAAVCLSIAAVIPVFLQLAQPRLILWPSTAAVVPAMVMLLVLVRYRSAAAAAMFIVVGGAATFWYTVTLSSQLPRIEADSAVYAVFVVALTCNAGPARTFLRSVLWSTAGFAMAMTALGAGTAIAGHGPGVHPVSVMLLVLLGVASARAAFGGGRTEALRRHLYRALRREWLDSLRRSAEREAAALLHDTLLGHVTALSHAPPGPLDAKLREAIESDLALLVGREWLVASHETAAGQASRAQAAGPPGFQLARKAIAQAEQAGITVALAGDLAALSRLDDQQARALDRAVEQCITNIRLHAEAEHAELVVMEGERQVAVLIVDSGKGFDVTAVPEGRLGLRESIQGRIERAGGTARIWSTPGSGTSVLLSVPLGENLTPPASLSDGAERGDETPVGAVREPKT